MIRSTCCKNKSLRLGAEYKSTLIYTETHNHHFLQATLTLVRSPRQFKVLIVTHSRHMVEALIPSVSPGRNLWSSTEGQHVGGLAVYTMLMPAPNYAPSWQRHLCALHKLHRIFLPHMCYMQTLQSYYQKNANNSKGTNRKHFENRKNQTRSGLNLVVVTEIRPLIKHTNSDLSTQIR